MQFLKTILLVFFLLGVSSSTNAQFWKKLKQKAQEKLSKAEDKIIDKLDKKTDKKIDDTIDGKKKKNKNDVNKSFGAASITHSILYGKTNITNVSKTKVSKEGNQIKILGYWNTFGVDVHDGYYLKLNNVTNINELQNKTFSIPNEASLQLDYDALVKGEFNYDQKERAPQQSVKFLSGTVTVTFNKDKNVVLSFNGTANINNHKTETDNLGIGGNTQATLTGNISTTSPEFSINKVFKKQEKQQNQNAELSESNKTYIKEKLSPTVDIPSTFNFHKAVQVEITDENRDTYSLEFLLGNYPDIWAMSVAPKELEGQGKMLMVITPKSSIGFMDVAGMKMKKATSLEQMGDQYNMDEKIPDGADFEYKKTGNTKTIAGYLCEEYRVDYDYTNSKGSTSFWVSKAFPIQNIDLPMLGMKMNNPYFNGFVLELSATVKGKNTVITVTDVVNKNVTIKSSEYRKMGF